MQRHQSKHLAPHNISQAFTVREVADIMGVTIRTVRKWIADGTLPRYKIGNTNYVRADTLETLQTPGMIRSDGGAA